MIRTICDPRTTDTKDLSASLRSDGRACVIRRVLSLDAGGMLINTDGDREVGEIARFELCGPGFRFAGIAEVAERDGRTMGLRFMSWQGPADRCVRALITARQSGQQSESDRPDPGAIGSAVWNSRKHRRVAVSGLSAIIDGLSEGATGRHEVLNVSEQGMLIDNLTRPVGAPISFRLAGLGINHFGRGRIAHQAGTIAGVAIDHWSAPQAFRALSGSEPGLDLTRADGHVTEWC